jgi:cytochrome c oxidase assembly factor CtaG
VSPTLVAGIGVWLLVAVVGVIYRRGWRRRRRFAGTGAAACFAGGLVALGLALGPPLDGWSGELLAAHMVQHLLLGVVAPLLLFAGRPAVVLGPMLPPELARPVNRWHRRWQRRPLPATVGALAVVVHVGLFWTWHVPALYDAAVDHVALHVFEHATLFAGGCALAAVVSPRRVVSVLYLFGAALGSGALGALLTVADHPWYTAHLATTAAWGLSPLDDQRLAGGIMWVPGGMIYTLAALVVFVGWFSAGESGARGSSGVRGPSGVRLGGGRSAASRSRHSRHVNAPARIGTTSTPMRNVQRMPLTETPNVCASTSEPPARNSTT